MKPEASVFRILVDAPCSNTGVMRRRTDLRWRVSQEEIRALHETQFSLLSRGALLLRPGASLVYSTCSIEPDENQNVVNRFMKRNSDDFTLEEQRQLSPENDGTDGAFVAKITRKQ
ncbi:S-adenosyl-L-methionine-dependent methyltransferase [Baffinella frigidus]|nr:S-adenosyl-L-methionine-dependent methyltransferase [Cryptophyta sp. CCMP2293]